MSIGSCVTGYVLTGSCVNGARVSVTWDIVRLGGAFAAPGATAPSPCPGADEAALLMGGPPTALAIPGTLAFWGGSSSGRRGRGREERGLAGGREGGEGVSGG